MTRRLPVLLLAVVALVAVAAAVWSVLRAEEVAAPQDVEATRLEPAAAADVADAIGVQIHLHYSDTTYDRFDDVVLPRLEELGVRHVRDAAYTYPDIDADHFYYQRVRELAERGIRFTLLTSIDSERGEATDLSQLEDVVAWSNGAVVAFEGANEPDLEGLPDDVWVERTRTLQQELWETVRSSETLDDLLVLAPAVAFGPDRLGDVSDHADRGNWHPYPGGDCPGCVESADLRALQADHEANVGDRPMQVTETGYHTAVEVDADEGHRPVSEEVQARYLPGLLLELFAAGNERIFLYELLDQRDDVSDREASFGLVRADGTTKPAFDVLRQLVALLDDPAAAGADPSPAPAAVDVDRPDDVAASAFTTTDGRLLVALWQRIPIWDRDEVEDRDEQVRDVTLHTDAEVVATRHPLDGAGESDELGRITELELELGAVPVVVELAP